MTIKPPQSPLPPAGEGQGEGGWRGKRRTSALKARSLRRNQVENYIVDSVCLDARLIVEIDGGQHCGSKTDDARTIFLEQRGYAVIRFWNNEVMENLDGLLATLALSRQREKGLLPENADHVPQ